MSLATTYDTVPSTFLQGELTRTECHHNTIDVSSTEAQKAFFRASFDMWGKFVRDTHAYTRRAITNGEALIIRRGRASIDLMDVEDVDTGEVQMQYRDALARDYVKMFRLGRITSNATNRLKSFLQIVIGDDDAIRQHIVLRDLLPLRASSQQCRKGPVIGTRAKDANTDQARTRAICHNTNGISHARQTSTKATGL